MKTYLLNRKFAAMMISLFMTVGLMAQSGTIKGTVKDGLGDPLPGASITIKGTTIGTITNLDGAYTLSAPVGEHYVIVKYVGYIDLVDSISVSQKEVTPFDVVLDIDNIHLGEVVVTGLWTGQQQAISQQVNSDNIVNVVSSERMEQLPDANIAESISRLPGITVTRSNGEASKVLIRGLGAQYTNVQIAGINIPSTSDDRSVGLGNISSEAMGGVEVYKAITPDMNPESTGGTVNMQLAKAKSKKKLYVKGGTFFGNEGPIQYDVTSKFSGRLFKDKIGLQVTALAERRNWNSSNIGANYSGNGIPDTSIVFQYFPPYDALPGDSATFLKMEGGSFQVKHIVKERYGANMSLDYNWKGHSFVFTSMYNYSTNTEKIWSTTGGTSRARYSLPENSKLINILQTRHEFNFMQADVTLSHSNSKSYNNNDYESAFGIEATGGVQLPHPHNIWGHDQYMKYEERFVLNKYNHDGQTIGHTSLNIYDRASTDVTAKIDLTFPFKIGSGSSISGHIKTGGMYRVSERKRRDHNESVSKMLLQEANYPGFDTLVRSDWNEDGFAPEIEIDGATLQYPVAFDALKGKEAFEYVKARVDPHRIRNFWGAGNDDYDVTEKTYAAYLMAKLNLSKYVTLIPGVRYEVDNNTYSAWDIMVTNGGPTGDGFINDTTVNKTFPYLLPMVHLQIKPTDWINIRLAYTKSITRPYFNRRVPKRSNNSSAGGTMYEGNPGLKTAIADNYDLMISLYKGQYGILSGGLFYKEIKDLSYGYKIYVPGIEKVTTEEELSEYGVTITHGSLANYVGKTYQQSRNQPGKNIIKGFEFDLQPNLLNLPGLLSGIVCNINYSHIWSQQDNYRYEFVTTYNPITWEILSREQVAHIDQTRKINQPSDIFNLMLGYENKHFGLRWSLYHKSDVLYRIDGQYASKDRYMDAITKQDISANVFFFDKKLTLFLNVQNLFDVYDISTIGTGAWTRYQRYETTPRSFEVSIKYNIL